MADCSGQRVVRKAALHALSTIANLAEAEQSSEEEGGAEPQPQLGSLQQGRHRRWRSDGHAGPRRKIGLTDLMAHGMLQPGPRHLLVNCGGRASHAELHADGSITDENGEAGLPEGRPRAALHLSLHAFRRRRGRWERAADALRGPVPTCSRLPGPSMTCYGHVCR